MWFDEAVLPPLAQRLNGKLYQVALLFCVAFLVLSFCRPLMDNVDLGWHVAQGRWMAHHGAIYERDMMNYPNLNRPLINEYPLFQALIYGSWSLGWWGLFTFALAMYGLLVFALLRAARLFWPEGSSMFVLTLALMLMYFQLAFPLRPHLATYLGVGILGVFLLRHRQAQSWKEFWPAALLQVAWTNCHSAFVLGPMMVGLFGLEMSLRRSLDIREIAWRVVGTWAGAFLVILAACFINPSGWARFYPPFYQGELEEIRAYVGEMQPLTGVASSLIALLTILAAVAVVFAAIRAGGAICYSFLLLAILLFVESLSVLKSWPVFGLFPPLLVLSSGAFGTVRPQRAGMAWIAAGVSLLVASCMLFALVLRLEPDSPVSIPATWQEYQIGRRELPYSAVEWMRARGLEGRILHRCEDGGLLQEKGYDHGETFGDTGFGKYDEKMIREVALIGERPALLSIYCSSYRPAFVLCNNLCFRWPYYLRQLGWRVIFYSTSGSVWAQPGTRADLPSLTGPEIEDLFRSDIALHGRPSEPLLFGRDLLALNSNGEEDFAFAQLTSLPSKLHRDPWYWEAARILCFETPRFSAAHRQQLLSEAGLIGDKTLTSEFRAFAAADAGNSETARQILEALPIADRSSHANDLLLKIDNDEHRPEALSRAESAATADLRDGKHWAYVAQAEENAGNEIAAAKAWRKAVFFYPDDSEIVQRARDFAAKAHDAALEASVAGSLDVIDH